MAERVLGPTGSKRRKRFLLVLALTAVCSGLLFTIGAQAVHNDGCGASGTTACFELGPNGSSPVNADNTTNIVGDANEDGPDWTDLFTATGPSGTTVTKKDANSNSVADCEESPGKACAFIADPASAGGALDPTTFSGFGTSNKNNDPVSTADCANRTPPLTGSGCAPWGWDAGNIPAKDDLTNVYAYEVIPTSGPRAGHVIIYGGLERESPSGDSYVDLEFFKSKVDVCRNSSGVATPTCFTGLRSDGDIIVSMNFLKGGSIGSIEIREFNAATGSYTDPLGAASGQGCFNKSGGSGDDICAFNNAVAIDGGPWANYDNHGNVITSIPANGFTEMGVDVTAVLGESPCISTFMGKTRSSASFTSELKDFAGPTSFSICAPSTKLTKTATNPTSGATVTTVHSGDPVKYVYAEQNDGKDPLSNVSVSDDSCTPVSATLKADNVHNVGDANDNGILDPNETWSFSCTVASLTANTTNTATATGFDALLNKTVTYCSDPANPPSGVFCDQDERAQATVNVIAPATSLTKTAKVTVVYTFKEKNTGNDGISNVAVTDANITGHDSGLGACTVAAVLGTDGVHNVGDVNNDGKLNAGTGGNGETWTFTCTVSSTDGTNVDVWNTGTGSGTDSIGTAVPSTNESDGVKVSV